MELKAGFKQTDIGWIPEDWEVKKLGEVSKPVRGGSPRPAGAPKYFNGNYIPWLTVAALTNIPSSQLYVSKTDSFLTQEGSIYSRTLDVGTLIIANSGATLGVAKLLAIKCCANDGIAALLDIGNEIDKNYLVYFINTKTNFLRSAVATGNGQPNLNTALISNFQVPLPPTKSEQTAIATALSDTDALLSSLDTLLTKKRNLKQAAMQRLLEPGEGWVVRKLGDIVAKITTGKLDANAMKEDGDYRFYTCAKDYYYIDNYAFDDEALLVSGNGANVGYIHYYKGRFNAYQRTYVLTGFSEDISFVKLYMDKYLKERIATEVSAGNTPYIKMDTLSDMQINFPKDKSEQTRIATILTDLDRDIEALEKKIAKYKAIKSGMMQNLLTGRVRLV